MKKGMMVFMLVCATCLSLLTGCNSYSIDVSYNLSLDISDDNLPLGLSIYDSTVFSDGSFAVYKCGFSPCNSAMDMRDASGQLLARYAAASETTGQYIVYDYNDQGNVERIIEFGCDNDNDGEKSKWMDRINEDVYCMDMPKLRNRIEEIDGIDFTSDFYTVYNFCYDEDKYLVSVSSNHGLEIVADNEYILVAETVPCSNFWISDLHGGHYHLMVKQVPKESGMKSFTERVYQNMVLQYEMDYVDNRPVHLRIYGVDGKYMKSILATAQNSINVYTHLYAGESEKKVEYWHQGVKQKEETISIYGTVLTRNTYQYLSNDEVKIVTEYIDFNTRKMYEKHSRIIAADEMGPESNVMDGNLYSDFLDSGYTIRDVENL